MNADEKLMSQVATRLAGEPVTLRFVQPCVSGVNGCCYRDQATRRIVIDQAPGLSESMSLRILTHELAHARLGHAPTGHYTSLAPGAYPKPDPAAATDPRETAADQLAKSWLDYAEYYRWNYTDRGWLDSRLAALAAWQPGVESKRRQENDNRNFEE